MENFKSYTTVCMAFFMAGISTLNAQESEIWDLSQKVTDQNTTVSFEVGTTWHVVYGKISNSTGTMKLANENNPLSVVSDIHFPVKSFDTDWDKRNQSLWEHMKVEKFPEVVLKTQGVKGECKPDIVAKGSCRAKLVGTLTICDVTKDVEVDVTIEKKADVYEVGGSYSFKWADYNVDDPSIIVAKVDPVVKVNYLVKLPVKKK